MICIVSYWDKSIVYSAVESKVKDRLIELQSALNDALAATADDSKSTAGDKHETSRAMAHLEQEKLGLQYAEALKVQELLHRIDPKVKNEKVGLGSLVETSMGWLFLSVGLGQIELKDQKIFCLTPIAPLGKVLIGKKAGDEIDWQGKRIQVLSVK
jgi:transcription elongation GreA/GreB family factor